MDVIGVSFLTSNRFLFLTGSLAVLLLWRERAAKRRS
jgi:hypothetical protein